MREIELDILWEIDEDKEIELKIKDVVNVMFATMSPNGYTYAKPDYQIIYLMVEQILTMYLHII